MPGPPDKTIVDGVRRMILSHAVHDEAGFAKGAEALIKQFVVTNHAVEARQLREALQTAQKGVNGTVQPRAAPLPLLNRSGDALVRLRTCRVNRERLLTSRKARTILDRVILEFGAATLLREHGLEPARRLLFWGPPGCGKTLAAQQLATELSLPLGTVRLGSLVSSYLGETSANLQKVFGQAEQVPMVLLLDEVDAIAASRTSQNDVGELRRVVNGLLQCLDDAISTRSIVVLATNHQHLFDSAVWRRFDEVLEFPLPDETARKAYLQLLLSGVSSKGTLNAAVAATKGMSFAEIERAVRGLQKEQVLTGSKSLPLSRVAAVAKEWTAKIARAARKSKPILK